MGRLNCTVFCRWPLGVLNEHAVPRSVRCEFDRTRSPVPRTASSSRGSTNPPRFDAAARTRTDARRSGSLAYARFPDCDFRVRVLRISSASLTVLFAIEGRRRQDSNSPRRSGRAASPRSVVPGCDSSARVLVGVAFAARGHLAVARCLTRNRKTPPPGLEPGTTTLTAWCSTI